MTVELGFIYYLKNTQTDEIFYVGSTQASLKSRLATHYQHLREVDKGKRNSNKRFDYLNELLPNKASIHLIKVVVNGDLHLLESYYILEYRKLYNLTNMTDGGLGGNTYKFQSDIDKKNIEVKISSKNKGKKKPDGFSDNLSKKRTGKGNPMSGKSKIGWIVCDNILLFKYGFEINKYLNNKHAYSNIIKNIMNKTIKAYNHNWTCYDKCDQVIQDIVRVSYESKK